MIKTITWLKLVFGIVLLWATADLSAQYYLLTGMVRDTASLAGIPNKMVVITQHNASYTKTVYTNNSGLFYDTLYLPYGVHKKFYATTMDCNNSPVTDTVISYTPGIAMLEICASGMPLCQAGFTYWQSGNNFKKVNFINTSSVTANKFLWTFGDGDTAHQVSPTHNYSTAGAFKVCLTAEDTNINCSSTYCDTVFVFPGSSCSNNFNHVVSNLSVYLQASVNTTFPTTYEWSFGDGTPTDTGQTILHTYYHGGTFQVCLKTISVNPWTMDTCIANKCKKINVSGGPLVNISGQIFRGTSYLDTGMVYLYEYHSSSGKYSLYDSASVIYVDSLNISYYYFDMIPVGRYMTKVVPLPSSTFYTTYAPAYYGNSVHWNHIPAFDLATQGYDYPMNLSEIKQWNGRSSIEGYVLEGTAKAPGDPVTNVPIYLLDDDNFLLGYTLSDAQGYYNFSDLPYHKYYLYADLINYNVIPSTTITSEGDRNKSDINIYIGNGQITGVQESEDVLTSIRLFPNPAVSEVNLILELGSEKILNIEVYDLLGKQILVYAQNEYFPPGRQQRTIDISKLPNGVYNLIISGTEMTSRQMKLIVVH
jgi:PKD repeat protein